MPVVNRQSANGPSPSKIVKKGGIRDRIKSLSEVTDISGVKFLLYGRGKTGKTRFACTFPKPLIIIGTEDGTKSVLGVAGVDFIRVSSTSDFGEIVDIARTGEYKTVVLDTAGGFQDIVLKEVLGLDEIPMQRSWGMAQQQDWGAVGAQFKERMRRLLDLANQIGLNVVVIAHERGFGDSDKPLDVMIPTIGPALSPTIAGWLNAEVDYIANAYIREQEVEKEFKQGQGKQVVVHKRMVKTGEKEYCLRVGPHNVFMTGFRLPPGVTLPDSLVDPHYTQIVKLLKGEYLNES